MNLIDLHPMFVHFPIAITLVALLSDVAHYYFKKDWLNNSTVALVVIAALGAIASVTSGALFTKSTSGLAETIKLSHANFAAATTCALIVTAIIALYAMFKYRYTNKSLQYVVTALLVTSAVLVAITGMKGGSIVYDVWLF